MEPDPNLILQNQATGIVLLNPALCVTYLNESAESLLNASLKQTLGVGLENLLTESEGIKQACLSVLANTGNVRLRDYSLRPVACPEIRQVSCVVSGLRSSGETAVILELTEEDAAGKISRDEEFVQRQQANQALIRGLAHEIRNPLGGIRGAAQLLSQEAADSEFSEYTSIIIRETDRLTALVNRMQANTCANLDQTINIHRLLEHVRQLMLADGKPLYRIIQDYDPSLPRVRGNGDLLIQALLNVIRNASEAVNALKRQGVIRLRTRIDHLAIDGKRQLVVRVEITDNGPGVPSAIAHQVFDPMVTGKPSGTGLGLPISAEIVNQHHGKLDFTSREGQTTFRFYLPVATDGEDSSSGNLERKHVNPSSCHGDIPRVSP